MSMLRKLGVAVAIASIGTAVAVGPAQAGASKTVSVKNNAFSPTSVNVKKGTKVTWKWTQGGVPHNVSPAGGGSGSKTSSKKGFTYSKTFSKAGTYKFICTVHPTQMKITVKVS
jgi:plastocyanin